MGLQITLIKNKEEFDEVLKLRKVIFVKGQSVPIERELDGFDDKAKHVILKYNGKPIGCARIRFIHGKAKLERIGILESYRGMGFGEKLTRYLIAYCKRKDAKEIVLHSQDYVQKFYEKFGFKTRGKPFKDAGINHVEMYMKV